MFLFSEEQLNEAFFKKKDTIEENINLYKTKQLVDAIKNDNYTQDPHVSK